MSGSGADVFPSKPSALVELFGTPRVLIGVVHSLPLPGSPHYRGQDMGEVVAFAVEEALAYREGGMHGVIVENAWDVPFSKPEDIGYETAASIAVMAHEVKEAVGLPIGINVLANGSEAAVAAAHASGAVFVRVNQWVNAYVANEGIIDGAAPSASRYRAKLRADQIRFFCDVHVKHGSHSIVADRSLREQTEDAVFFDADVIIATGGRTGDETSLHELNGIREATELPVIVGSGMTEDNADELLSVCDGAIVGSSLKDNGHWWGRVSVDAVKTFAGKAWRLGYEPP